MKLLTKTLIAAGLLAATCTAWGDICNSGNPNNLPNPVFQRTVVIGAFLDPNTPFIDPGHNLMLNQFPGLYQQSDAVKLDTDAINFFYNTYGVDFRPSNAANLIPTPDGSGVILLDSSKLPICALFPIIFGQTLEDALVLDTKNTNWSLTHDWYYWEVADGIEFISSYKVPAGFAQAGAMAQPGNIALSGLINLLAHGTDLTKPVNREEFTFRTHSLIAEGPNEFGEIVFANYLDIYDAMGNPGRYIAPSINTHSDPSNPINDKAVRVYWPTFTWNCPGTPGPSLPPPLE